jgi:hypothetical protein
LSKRLQFLIERQFSVPKLWANFYEILWSPNTAKQNKTKKKETNSVALVRKPTIPTERPPLVGEVSANFSGQKVSRGQRNESPRPLISVF